MNTFKIDFESYKKEMLEQNKVLADKIMKENKVTASSIEAYSFIVSVLIILHPNISIEDFKHFIIDDRGDEQIDVIVIENSDIFLYDFKVSAGFGEGEIRLFKESIEKYIFSTHEIPEGAPKNLKNLVSRTRELIKEQDISPSINIRVVRGSGTIENSQNLDILKNLDFDTINETSFWSLNEIISEELNINKSPLKTKFKFNVHYNNKQNDKSSIIIKHEKKIESIICRIKLKELVELYNQHQPTPENLFISNVRAYQNNKKLSDGILESLSNVKKAKEFYKKHNGIAIVCDEIKKHSNFTYSAINPQIINGCQTITTISKKFENELNNKVLEYGTVIAKIFKTLPTEVESICFASNRQVEIQDSDLRTNDNIQIILESFLKKAGFKYDRKVNKTKKGYDLTFTEVGQYLASGVLQKPHVSKNEKALIYSLAEKSYYTKIFKEDIDLSDVKEKMTLAVWLKQRIKLDKKYGKQYEIANFQIYALLAAAHLKEGEYEQHYVLAKNIIDDEIIDENLDEKSFITHFVKTEKTYSRLVKRYKFKMLEKHLNILKKKTEV